MYYTSLLMLFNWKFTDKTCVGVLHQGKPKNRQGRTIGGGRHQHARRGLADVDELLVAQAQWLPQYAHATPAAVERLKSHRVKTRNGEGAARLKVRPVEELRAAKAKLAVSVSHSLGTKVLG